MYQAKGRDCFFYILRKWKVVLGVALAGAILMCGLDVYKTLSRWDRDKKQCEQDAIEYDEAYAIASDREASYDAQIEADEAEIALIRENPIIEYDRDTIGSASGFIQFDAKTNEDGSVKNLPTGLVSIYTNALTDITDWDKVGAKGNLEGQYAKSLFSYTADDAGNTIYIKIFGETQAEAEAMLDEIIAQIYDYTNSLDETTKASFDVSVVNKIGKSGKDDGFNSIQDSINNKIRDYINETVNLNNIKAEIEYPAPAPTMPTKADVAKSFVKYFLFGFVAGAGALVCLYYLLFFFNGKLHSTEELGAYTKIGPSVFLGKKYGKIDKTIALKENRGLILEQDEAISRTVKNIKSMYPDVETIAFTGAASDSYIEKLKPSLEKIKDMGLRFGLEKNILTDKEAFEHLQAYDAIVLVEKIDCADSVVIQREIEQIEIAGKKVAGAILIR